MRESRRQGTAGIAVADLLENSAWFPHLDESARQQVRHDVIERAVRAGDALIRHGDRALFWFGVLLEGVLKWSTTTTDGRSVTLGGLTIGSWFGEGSLLHGQPVQADIVALRHRRVAMIPAQTFEWLWRTQLPFCHFLLHQLNERLHWFMGDFTGHRLFSAEALVARALLGLVHPWLQPRAQRRLAISQEEITYLAGLS